MRTTLTPLIAALALLSAPAADAGGAWCQKPNGDSIRCHAPGAMPLGWTASASQRVEPQRSASVTPGAVAGLIGVIGGLFALIALMPEFQGRRGGWDEQQCDAEEEPG
jgi:hypothetical protein